MHTFGKMERWLATKRSSLQLERPASPKRKGYSMEVFERHQQRKRMRSLGRCLKNLDAETACGICLKNFEQPRLLSCLHTFCTGCLHTEDYLSVAGVVGVPHNLFVPRFDEQSMPCNSNCSLPESSESERSCVDNEVR